MKKLFFISVLLLSFTHGFSQNQSDTIEVRNNLGAVFIQNGKQLSPRSLLYVTKINEEAYDEMKIAKRNFDVGSIFGYSGGFLFGWQLGTAVGGGKPNWTLAGIGAGLILVSIPFSNAYSKHAKNAVKIFNRGLKNISSNKIDANIGLTFNGIAIKVTF